MKLRMVAVGVAVSVLSAGVGAGFARWLSAKEVDRVRAHEFR
jgi:hypothetical protein